MRFVFFVVVLLVLVLSAYVGTTGYFLARATAGVLQTGPISASLANADRPTDPLAIGYRGNPLQALSLPFETLSIETPLGPAEAWLVPARGPEKGRAIYVHGIAGAREDGYRHLAMLHQAGWSVLLISYRNDPAAPAAAEGYYGFGLLEWPDLEAAIAHLTPADTGPGVLVVADAMGAAVLGQFLRQSPLAARVKAVALDSPALSFSAVTGQLAANDGKPLPGAVALAANLLLPMMTGLPLDQAEVADVFQAFPGPLFLAHGASDQTVPIAPSEELAAGRAGPGSVTVWTGADHLGSYTADPAAYSAAFTGFLSGI